MRKHAVHAVWALILRPSPEEELELGCAKLGVEIGFIFLVAWVSKQVKREGSMLTS